MKNIKYLVMKAILWGRGLKNLDDKKVDDHEKLTIPFVWSFFNIPSFFVNYMLLKSLKSLECWLDILLSKEVIWCCFDNIHRMNKGIHNILRRGNVLFNHSSILSNLMYFNKRQTQYTTVARFIFYSYIQFIIHLEY